MKRFINAAHFYLSSSANGGSDGIPIGTIIMRTSDFLKTSEGAKYLLCDGSEVPSSYSKLRSLMTYTPDLRDRVPQGAGTYNVNTFIEAALPNLMGDFSANMANVQSRAEGAFYIIRKGRMYVTNGINDTIAYAFDASRYNSIYKNDCNTVQPPALAVNFYIKAK